MRQIVSIILLVLAFITSSHSADQPKKINRVANMLAVFDLEIQGQVDKSLVRALTDSVRLEVVKAAKYKVIDRGNMDKILKEQAFQMTGCVAKECAVEAGQLLGVGKIIVGSLNLIGKTYYLTLTLVDVETGETVGIEEDICKCEVDDLIMASKRAAGKLMGVAVAEAKVNTSNGTSSEVKSAASDIEPEMVLVKGGCFLMGDMFGDGDGFFGGSDEKPVHEVCVGDYYIGKYEVTQGQWKNVQGNTPSKFSNCGDNCPVEQVSWNDAQDYISTLNQRTGKTYRLPTEAEWEYAARSGGKSEKYAGGDNVDSVSWYGKNSDNQTHRVGQKKPNGLGIYDMSGNVWEWCQDWYDSDYYKNSPKENPQGPSTGSYRVLRGGSWSYLAAAARAAYRGSWGSPGRRDGYFGFRLARTK